MDAIAHARQVTAGGYRINVIEGGAGEPVVLLHGSGPGVSAAANWSATIPRLVESGFRVLAPDILGFGDSEKPADFPYGAESWADQLALLLDELGIAAAHLVGNSMGGRIALTFAVRHPGRTLTVTTMGVRGPGSRPTPGLATVRNYEPSLSGMRQLLAGSFLHDPSLLDDDTVVRRFEASVQPGAHEAYVLIFKTPGANDLPVSEDELAALKTPVLILHGREDAVIPAEFAFELGALIPRSTVVVLSQCGHWVQVERAADFVPLVAHFIRTESKAQ